MEVSRLEIAPSALLLLARGLFIVGPGQETHGRWYTAHQCFPSLVVGSYGHIFFRSPSTMLPTENQDSDLRSGPKVRLSYEEAKCYRHPSWRPSEMKQLLRTVCQGYDLPNRNTLREFLRQLLFGDSAFQKEN